MQASYRKGRTFCRLRVSENKALRTVPVEKGRDKGNSGNCIMRNFLILHSLHGVIMLTPFFCMAHVFKNILRRMYHVTSAVGFAMDSYI
jgi:hypothetical protein